VLFDAAVAFELERCESAGVPARRAPGRVSLTPIRPPRYLRSGQVVLSQVPHHDNVVQHRRRISKNSHLVTIIWPWLLLLTAMSLPRDPQAPPELPLHISIQQRNFNSDRQRVPGSSPAYYNGDPRNDILVIEELDLIPNPPVE